MTEHLARLSHQHDLSLVFLALLVCATASLATFNLLNRAEVSGTGRRAWLFASAFSFGLGVWATHSVAMLGYRMGMPVRYNLARMALSAFIPIIGGFLALNFLEKDRAGKATSAIAAAIIAISIGMMHFMCIGATSIASNMTIELPIVALSIGLCWVFGTLALLVFRSMPGAAGRITASSLLVLCILIMHFTAMSAMTVGPESMPDGQTGALTSDLIGILVAGVSLIILLMSLTSAFVDRLLTQEALQSAERFRQLADCSFEGILIHDGHVVQDANAAFAKMLGLPLGMIVGQPLDKFLSGESAETSLQYIDTNKSEIIETAILRIDGELCPVEVLTRPIEVKGRHLHVVAARDISERKAAEAKILHMAHHDALTGLANRFSFGHYLDQALAQAERTGDTVHVFFLDLDRFKMVNDLFGHPGGDELLRQVTERLRCTVRAMDTVSRLGGDEFAIIQPASGDPGEASALAERVVEVLGEPYTIFGQNVVCGASVGIATFPKDSVEPDKLLRHADVALYRAKAEGRGRYCLFEAAMDTQLQERRRMEADLRRAIGEQALEVYYQPLFNCVGEEAVLDGFEALLRWNHPVRGGIHPSEFIPLAEESGLIVSLGKWVLEKACAEAATWEEPHTIAVNLSPTQFKHSDLVGMIARTLKKTGLKASRLELEITEGVLIVGTKQTLATLEAIKALGVRLSLDDFGTGYSSLSYLQRFPFDKLKIDRSFISNLMTDENSAEIVRAIISLARSLKLEVTAEGVETLSQFDLLRTHDCTQIQGFFLGRPMPASAIRHMRLGSVVGVNDTETYAISA